MINRAAACKRWRNKQKLKRQTTTVYDKEQSVSVPNHQNAISVYHDDVPSNGQRGQPQIHFNETERRVAKCKCDTTYQRNKRQKKNRVNQSHQLKWELISM